MAEQDLGGASPQDKLTPQRTTQPDAERTGANVPGPFRDVFGKLGETPSTEDPAYWPVKVLNELNYMILHRDEAPPGALGVWDVPAREVGERFAPYEEHIRKVKTAYEILAFPHCKYQGSRDLIDDELSRDQRAFERDQVELNDPELAILSHLAAAKNIPFNPEKPVYRYEEVLHPPPDIEPALDGAEFIKWVGEQRRAREQGKG
jgi:hypothetical protein